MPQRYSHALVGLVFLTGVVRLNSQAPQVSVPGVGSSSAPIMQAVTPKPQTPIVPSRVTMPPAIAPIASQQQAPVQAAVSPASAPTAPSALVGGATPQVKPIVPSVPSNQPALNSVAPMVPNQPLPAKESVATQSAPKPLVAPTAPSQFQAPGKAPVIEQEEEPQGIDTMNAANAQGNWLFKRMWWQRAQTQYEKTKMAVDAIMESRMAFFAKRTEWDKTVFDPFYQDSGLGRGVLEELISTLINQLSQERSHEGQLDEKERDLLVALESQKAVLEQLQKDVQKINDIDNAIDQAISVLIQQINVARNFEKQSWQNFKTIAQELNDKKARELYYGMVTYWQNINEIGQYIQMPFLQHFEKLGAMAKDQTEKVLGVLKALKEKGIDFKKQWQQLEENALRQSQAHEYKDGLEQGKKEVEAEKAAEQGLFASILSTASNAISSIWHYTKSAAITVWDFTLGRFFSSKASPAVDAENQSESHHSAPDKNSAVSAGESPVLSEVQSSEVQEPKALAVE